MDVHVEDEAKLSSTTTNNIEDVVSLKSKEETSINEKFENLEQNDSVGHEGTKYKGTNIFMNILVMWILYPYP